MESSRIVFTRSKYFIWTARVLKYSQRFLSWNFGDKFLFFTLLLFSPFLSLSLDPFFFPPWANFLPPASRRAQLPLCPCAREKKDLPWGLAPLQLAPPILCQTLRLAPPAPDRPASRSTPSPWGQKTAEASTSCLSGTPAACTSPAARVLVPHVADQIATAPALGPWRPCVPSAHAQPHASLPRDILLPAPARQGAVPPMNREQRRPCVPCWPLHRGLKSLMEHTRSMVAPTCRASIMPHVNKATTRRSRQQEQTCSPFSPDGT